MKSLSLIALIFAFCANSFAEGNPQPSVIIGECIESSDAQSFVLECKADPNSEERLKFRFSKNDFTSRFDALDFCEKNEAGSAPMSPGMLFLIGYMGGIQLPNKAIADIFFKTVVEDMSTQSIISWAPRKDASDTRESNPEGKDLIRISKGGEQFRENTMTLAELNQNPTLKNGAVTALPVICIDLAALKKSMQN